MPTIYIGSILTNKQGSKFIIESIDGRCKVGIRYLDERGYRTTVPAVSIKRGCIKNPYHPVIYGVGYMGVGGYRSAINGKRTAEYEAWKAMLSRAYDESLHKRNSAYIGCSVHKDWHDFQVFAAWLNAQPNWGKKGFELDKDIKKPGNKIYCKEFCELIPRRVNSLRLMTRARDGVPPGVTVSPNGKFRASCRNGVRDVKLGTFETKEAAFEAYKRFKEDIIKGAAEEYRDAISREAYLALINHEVVWNND